MAKQSFFVRPTQVLEHVDDPAKTVTTLTAIAAKGASSLTVASITGISNGATIRIGAGETCEWNKVNGAPSGSTVNLTWPLGKAHAIGEQAIPGITYDFGDPTEDGATVSCDLNSQDVFTATKRAVYAILDDYATASVEWSHPHFTMPQLASALGMLQSRVTGSGTSSAPYQLVVDGTLVGEDINRGVVILGKLADGSDIVFELHGCDKDYTGFKATLKQGTLASIPHKAIAMSQIIVTSVAPGYTVDSSKKPTKAKVFSLPSEFGVFAQAGTPLNSTLSADAAAGATSFTVASSTNGAAGDRVLLSTADDSEVLIVDTVPDSTHVTTRNQANYPHLTGTTIVEQQQVPFGGVTDDGLSLELGGSSKEVAIATSRFKGILPNTVTMSMAFMLGDILLANIAYAFGAPQADISAGRIALSANIGTSDIPAAYFRGVLQGGGTLEINAFGITQAIKGIATALNGKDVAKLPLTLRPSTLQFLQY